MSTQYPETQPDKQGYPKNILVTDPFGFGEMTDRGVNAADTSGEVVENQFAFTIVEEVPADLQRTLARLREADGVHRDLVDHVLDLQGNDAALVLSYLVMLEKDEAVAA